MLLSFAGAVVLSHTLTQCTAEVPNQAVDAMCSVEPTSHDFAQRAPTDLAVSSPDLAIRPDLAVRRTQYTWWEFTKWWHLIGHGGGYCAPDDGNWMNVMDAFCKGYGFSWAVFNGTRPVGNCTTWDARSTPVYDTIVCGP